MSAEFLLFLAASLAVDLENTKWLLKDAPSTATLPPRARWHIAFNKGRVAIKACNAHSGPYKVEGDRLIVGRIVSTMMACLPEAAEPEQAFLALAAGKPQIRIEGSMLTLSGSGGSVWSFSRQPVPSTQAVTKFIYVASEKAPCTAGETQTTCLQIRESKDQPWRLNYTPIAGFEHQAGIEYRLRIKEDKIPQAPADGSSVAWYLDLIVEQKAVKPANR